MSTPAGWYPQPDGQQRYWDGELWTEHFAPGAIAETMVLPVSRSKPGFVFRGRSLSKAASFGWCGLALAALIGGMSSGFSGTAIMVGLFSLVVGAIALARGRVGWARLGSRAAGGVAVGAAMILFTVGAVAAPPSTAPTGESTMTSSGTSTTVDEGAEAAAQAAAAEAAAAEVAATEAAAAEKATADASAQATADAAALQATADAAAAKATEDAVAAKATADAAAAKATEDAVAAKATADAVAARTAKAAAAQKAQAAAAAKAKAKAAAAPPPEPPAADVYYQNCTAARAAGAAPIMRGEPGYASKLDRDNDGIACE